MKLSNKSLVYTGALFVVSVFALYINTNYRYYQITIELSEFAFWLAVPGLAFSVITLFLRESVASSWRKFTNYFIAISITIILITPNSSHGMDIYPLIKENVTIVLASLYSIISLFLILYKSFMKGQVS